MDRLTGMQVFALVVETGSFSAASERLGISRAAASKYVSQLEAHLGGRLLHRTTRRVNPTEPGRAYFERCKEILQNLEEAEGMVSGLSQQPRGLLRMSAPSNLASRHIMPMVSEFMQTYPEIRVELMCSERTVDLVDEGFDLALRISAMPDPELVARRLAPIRHVLVASPGYLAKHPLPTRPQDLERHACVLYSHTPNATWQFTKDGARTSVKVSGSMITDNPDVILESAIAGLGITYLPSFLISDPIRSGELRLVLEDYEATEMSLYAVYASRKHLPAKTRVFIDFIKERISDPPYWDHFLGERR
jgi:DNA-binding transcriptional LysR family regulator